VLHWLFDETSPPEWGQPEDGVYTRTLLNNTGGNIYNRIETPNNHLKRKRRLVPPNTRQNMRTVITSPRRNYNHRTNTSLKIVNIREYICVITEYTKLSVILPKLIYAYILFIYDYLTIYRLWVILLANSKSKNMATFTCCLTLLLSWYLLGGSEETH
jgi:hypothetical protein